ncbi:hypothetical protein WA026_002660 [Henosepilachna vigintioctopunctata]|uniref:Uncharacterized protein n=1 Tax=Henosepilachna vigintioctopunctata TaxID=420089 RepID=A0AAW1U0U6_9CUCU
MNVIFNPRTVLWGTSEKKLLQLFCIKTDLFNRVELISHKNSSIFAFHDELTLLPYVPPKLSKGKMKNVIMLSTIDKDKSLDLPEIIDKRAVRLHVQSPHVPPESSFFERQKTVAEKREAAVGTDARRNKAAGTNTLSCENKTGVRTANSALRSHFNRKERKEAPGGLPSHHRERRIQKSYAALPTASMLRPQDIFQSLPPLLFLFDRSHQPKKPMDLEEPNTNRSFQSLLIQETNKLRAKLGRKPSDLRAAAEATSSSNRSSRSKDNKLTESKLNDDWGEFYRQNYILRKLNPDQSE